MFKKMISTVTIVTFLVYSLSCYTTKKEKLYTTYSQQREKIKILGVMKKSGERIDFPKENPATLKRNAVVGIGIKEIEIQKEDIVEIDRKRGYQKIKIVTKDNKQYDVLETIFETEEKIVFTYNEPISIPISEVELAWVKRVDPVGSFFATIGVLALAVGMVFLVILLTKESCPFIYSFDGEKYIFDAEPYGGATCEGRKRTEWCGLEHIKEVNGQYRIKVTNEVDETQYTDELKLVVVDYPKEVNVVPDESGEMHTVSNPILPLHASDKNGRNIMPYISENDWIFWQSETEGRDPEKKEDLKDELNFVFPKPVNVTQAKLVFNGCNTLWGSNMLKNFLELYGNQVHKRYEEINSFGPAYYKTLLWNIREEFYKLQIRVLTREGWKTKGSIIGGGPFISEDRVYMVDINDVIGDTLKIKLTPPVTFWMINYVALDYTEDIPVQVQEIKAMEATDYKGNDIRTLLSETDKNYHVMPNTGDWAELVYKAPEHQEDLERSVIIKASGYYDIHLQAEGEPRTEILDRFVEPGFAIQYAFKEYLKWEKHQLAKLNQ